MLARFSLIIALVLTACSTGSEPPPLTCDFSNEIAASKDVDLQSLFHGVYYQGDDLETVASRCFDDGRSLGMAEVACALIRELDGDQSAYTLLFTDEDGATLEVPAADHIRLGPDSTGLDSLARKLPFLSACPVLVPPLE